MRITKPYGRTHVERDPSGATKRVLRLRSAPYLERDIEQFALTHDELVIAQWVSTIDKISTKPRGKNGPTEEQRWFRRHLGDAAWLLLVQEKHLAGAEHPARLEGLKKLWASKIEPYGSVPYKPSKFKPPPSTKGRWYIRFAGDCSIADASVSDIARQIQVHLYQSGFRLGSPVPKRGGGHISVRAKSITGNVARSNNSSAGSLIGWTAADCARYTLAGNVAQDIRVAAEKRERKEDGAATTLLTHDIAGQVLFRHYARLFPAANGGALTITQARESQPGLFHLHLAVKDCYARILKRPRKEKNASPQGTEARAPAGQRPSPDKNKDTRDKRSALFMRLPTSMEGLFALIENKIANRDLNALVRLGKVIHYEASWRGRLESTTPLDANGVADQTNAVSQNWPTDVTSSRYWTSQGQSEIKFNEGFVRVWRHTVAIASRTLVDWADPKRRIEAPNVDILLQGAIKDATGAKFDADGYTHKVPLLFGNRSSLFENGDDEFGKEVLRFALEGLAGLRHNSFHFKGLGAFVDALVQLTPSTSQRCLDAVRNLWSEDRTSRARQQIETMSAARFDYFFDTGQAQKLIEAVSPLDAGTIPLPRFNRLLERAQNAWSEGENRLGFPSPANRVAMENPALLCQYTALKLVYEHAFRAWLQLCSPSVLNSFIARAIARTTSAARELNAAEDVDWRDLIVARAAHIGRLGDDDSVETFFFNLSAETASEMRVQRGYESDPDKAREQSVYIDKFKCDVVALAFDAFLQAECLDFVLTLAADAAVPNTPLCDLSSLAPTEADVEPQSWQPALYFLMHLVPVDDVGKLLHQIRKSDVLVEGDPDSRRASSQPRAARPSLRVHIQYLLEVFELYLDMHDAKHTGGLSLAGTQPIRGLFEQPTLFDQVFPEEAPCQGDDVRIPRRGLREIMRFGHLTALQNTFDRHPVAVADVKRYLAAEQVHGGRSEIFAQHKARERLHQLWTQKKKDFKGADLQQYVSAVLALSNHRQLVGRVTLAEHIRVHRLLMAVMGRLVDFSGLWERDLYFVTLAIIHNMGFRPSDIFSTRGLDVFHQGRISDALRRGREPNAAADRLAQELTHHFGTVCEKKRNKWVEVRNAFAHFNMMKTGFIDLTACLNDARFLMAYDRKLENAVSQSVKALLYREGLEIEWVMEGGAVHRLGRATLQSRQIRHLGKTKLVVKASPGRTRSFPIYEDIHSYAYVSMVAALFDRCEPKFRPSICDLLLADVDWDTVGEKYDRTARVNKSRGDEHKTVVRGESRA